MNNGGLLGGCDFYFIEKNQAKNVKESESKISFVFQYLSFTCATIGCANNFSMKLFLHRSVNV